MLKIIVLAFCLTSVLCTVSEKNLGDKLQKLAPKLNRACREYTGVSEEDVDKVLAGDFDVSELTKRYVACIWLETGIVNFKLKPNTKRMDELEPPFLHGSGTKIYTECALEGRKADVEEVYLKIFEATKCAYKADPKNFIMF